METRNLYKSKANDIYKAITSGDAGRTEYLLSLAASQQWFIKHRSKILNVCLNIPSVEFADRFDRKFDGGPKSDSVYDYEHYEYW